LENESAICRKHIKIKNLIEMSGKTPKLYEDKLFRFLHKADVVKIVKAVNRVTKGLVVFFSMRGV
jgi:hypothetical protein